MNDQNPIQQEPLDRREARRQRRAERLADPSRGSAWIVGLILIVLGTMFLMNNLGTFNIPIKNWWALFILLRYCPACLSLRRRPARPGRA
jgi:hypothetical protein